MKTPPCHGTLLDGARIADTVRQPGSKAQIISRQAMVDQDRIQTEAHVLGLAFPLDQRFRSYHGGNRGLEIGIVGY